MSYTAPKPLLLLIRRTQFNCFVVPLYQLELCTLKRELPIWLLWGETSHGPRLSWTMRQCSYNTWFHTDVTPWLPGLLAMATRPCNSFPLNKPEWQHVLPLWVALCLREKAASHFLMHHKKQTQKTEHRTQGPRTVHASTSAQMEGCGQKTEPERGRDTGIKSKQQGE